MTIEKFLGPTSVFGWIGLVIMGSIWFGLTIGILCIMEVRFDAMLCDAIIIVVSCPLLTLIV
jgi:hypothetical protein